jgi:hypothetical protein
MTCVRPSIIVALTLSVMSCTPPPKPALIPQQRAADPQIVPLLPPPAAMTRLDPDLVTDERAIAAAQRALNQLGYDVGDADGIGGPATRHAILAFEKDRGLAENGRLTLAVAEKIRAALQTELAKTAGISVRPGDMLIYSDGVVEVASAERTVQWEEDDSHSLVAIRPSVAAWPTAARVGLDWAITHTLDLSTSHKSVKWSSTGVAQHFSIVAFPALTAREAGLVGGDPESCRRFEMRTDELQWRYPAIACRDDMGVWYIPHSTIRLARPATGLGASTVVKAKHH